MPATRCTGVTVHCETPSDSGGGQVTRRFQDFRLNYESVGFRRCSSSLFPPRGCTPSTEPGQFEESSAVQGGGRGEGKEVARNGRGGLQENREEKWSEAYAKPINYRAALLFRLCLLPPSPPSIARYYSPPPPGKIDRQVRGFPFLFFFSFGPYLYEAERVCPRVEFCMPEESGDALLMMVLCSFRGLT